MFENIIFKITILFYILIIEVVLNFGYSNMSKLLKKRRCTMVKNFLIILTLPVIFAACSSQLIRTGESHPNTELLSSNESALIFYRMDGDKNFAPTIMVDNRVVGSLLPNRFAQTRVCKGNANIGFTDALKGAQTVQYNPPMTFNGSDNVYVKVNETSDGHFSLTQIDDKSAKDDLAKLNAESHVINRHNPDCTTPIPEAPPAPAPIVIVEQAESIVLQCVNLSSDALFAFGKSQLEDMFPKGRMELDALVQKIQSDTMNVERLKVSGYTDRLGSDALNMKLSQARAQTVADYLRTRGVTIPIEVVGYGSSNPITTWCKGPKSAKLIECLQPDRRVNIDLIGQKIISK